MSQIKTSSRLVANNESANSKESSDKLVIGVTSSALFDMSESHQVFVTSGVKAYADYQVSRECDLLKPGEAFSLVRKLLALNKLQPERVEVILLSRNSSDTGLRVFNSIARYQLPVTRAAFCSGQSPYRYAKAYGCHLLLSTHADDVRLALDSGIAAAMILPSSKHQGEQESQVRIAFDGDAVVFSDESERIYQQQGLNAFVEHEQRRAHQPMKDGPFRNFLSALHQLQNYFDDDDCPIRTALVTARSAPAHERVVRTLRSWGVRIDEALFLGGMPKGEFLKMFGADIFFDDQHDHCQSACEHVATAHVPHGVANEDKDVISKKELLDRKAHSADKKSGRKANKVVQTAIRQYH